MKLFLFDTNICVFLLNRRGGFERIVERMDGLERGSIGLSAISAAELEFGVSNSSRPRDNLLRLERFLAELDVLPFDHAAARAYGPLRTHLKQQGTPIGNLDLLIAAHALALRATLVTNNVREFSRVPALAVQDWTDSELACQADY